MPDSTPTDAEGGSLAGVPNIYLIYWARLTDSPPLRLKIMFVKYVLRERPVFVFDTCCVPAEYYISYGVGTSIYDFLNSHLLPADIDSVRMVSDGVDGYVAVVYRLSDKLQFEMPSFMPLEEDDCPF